MYLGEKVYGNFRNPPVRDENHLRFLRGLPCPISGRYGCIAHHLLDVPDERGVAQKAGDDKAIPMDSEIHNILHHVDGITSATETEYLISKMRHGLTPHGLALFLWHNTGDYERCENFILGRTT